MKKYYGGIEAGGTKFCLAICDEENRIISETSVSTRRPEETIPDVLDFFRSANISTPLKSIGIASFGPVDLDIKSKTYGYITSTPKPGWANFNFQGAIKDALNIPSGFDTDVNGAALGEYLWGAARGLDSFIYVTVGTGIGAGGLISGKPMHGLTHPEMGHILIPHDLEKDPFPGSCPYHGDCLEGLANGPAMEKRWGIAGKDLGDDHPAWDLEAHYLATAFANYTLTLSPQRIIAGGGVMNHKGLIEKIRPLFIKYLGGYVAHKSITENIDEFIVLPGLGNRAGIFGAIALGRMSINDLGRLS